MCAYVEELSIRAFYLWIKMAWVNFNWLIYISITSVHSISVRYVRYIQISVDDGQYVKVIYYIIRQRQCNINSCAIPKEITLIRGFMYWVKKKEPAYEGVEHSTQALMSAEFVNQFLIAPQTVFVHIRLCIVAIVAETTSFYVSRPRWAQNENKLIFK